MTRGDENPASFADGQPSLKNRGDENPASFADGQPSLKNRGDENPGSLAEANIDKNLAKAARKAYPEGR